MAPIQQALFSKISFLLIVCWPIFAAEINSTISPSSTFTVVPVTSTIAPTTMHSVPTPPPTKTLAPTTGPKVPTPPPMKTSAPNKFTKRIYDIEYTLAKYPWKPTEILGTINNIMALIAQLNSTFERGRFQDFIAVRGDRSKLMSNDNGKVRAHLKAHFDAAPAGSQEPEVFLFLQKDKGELGNFTFERIVVNESVIGGSQLGNWKGGSCDLCCGQRYYQNRTCTPKANCSGILTNRTIACQWNCSLQCGIDRKFTFIFTLTNAWKEDYNNTQSNAYKELYGKLSIGDGSLISQINEIFNEFKKKTAYKKTSNEITVSNDKDKVQVSITVMFGEPPSDPEDPEALFRFKTENGQLGDYKIDVKSIRVKEETNGYRFSSWTNKEESCNECCGGIITQTRTCTSVIGTCSNAQLQRKIKCRYVCSEVECSGSHGIVPGLFITFSFLLLTTLI